MPNKAAGQWTHDLDDVNLPVFEEEVGPNHQLPTVAKPLEYFLLFLPAIFFEPLSDETNKLYNATDDNREWQRPKMATNNGSRNVCLLLYQHNDGNQTTTKDSQLLEH